MTSANDHPAGHAGERILEHSRRQLSALMDGALSPDEARFLLRRLQHDEELAGCWTRWQLCGAVLRGQASVLVRSDFPQRVAAAVAADGAGPGRRGHAASHWTRSRWTRLGGGAALAASVAMFALLVARQAPGPALSSRAPSQVAIQSPPAAAPALASIPAPVPAPDTAAQLAVATALADVPRRALRRSRGQGQRAAIGPAVRAASIPRIAVAAAGAADVDPFAPHPPMPDRPWPRTLLTEVPTGGGFTVDYGSAGTSPFHPFAPGPPARPNAQGASANGTDPRQEGSHAP